MTDFEGGSGFDGGFEADETPDQFAFLPLTGATPGQEYYATALLTGLDSGAYLVVTNGELSVNGGATWTTGTVNFVPGLTRVKVSVTASVAYNAGASKTVSVNGVSASYSVTTGAAAAFIPSDISEDEYYHYIEGRMRVFLASAPPVQRAIQVIEIRHSSIATQYLWREPYTGTVTLDDESIVTVQPLNMAIKIAGNDAHLDQKFDVAFDTVDINDTFRAVLDSIPLATTERVVMVYREYLSDDLTTPQITVTLQVESIGYNKGAARISAVSPRLNMTRTGQLYSYRQFASLRGFL